MGEGLGQTDILGSGEVVQRERRKKTKCCSSGFVFGPTGGRSAWRRAGGIIPNLR